MPDPVIVTRGAIEERRDERRAIVLGLVVLAEDAVRRC
jgi:hypothetical protein